MKKLTSLILALVLIFALSSCQNKENADELKRENEELKAKIEAMEKEEILSSSDRVTISGGFEARVRYKIPDYNLTDKEDICAVVNMFQTGPMVIYLGEELIDEVEEGKSYFFTIYDREIDAKRYKEHPENLLAQIFSEGSYVKIKSVEPVDTMGLEGNKLKFIIEDISL